MAAIIPEELQDTKGDGLKERVSILFEYIKYMREQLEFWGSNRVKNIKSVQTYAETTQEDLETAQSDLKSIQESITNLQDELKAVQAELTSVTKSNSLTLKSYTAAGGMYSATGLRFSVNTGTQIMPKSAELVLNTVRVRSNGLQSDVYTDKGTLTANTLSNGSVSFLLEDIAPQSGTFTANTSATVLFSGTLKLTY